MQQRVPKEPDAKGAAPTQLAWYRRFFTEILTAVAALVGWLLVTWGLAELLIVWVWPISLGALLLGLAGWRFVWQLLVDGLYVLSKPDETKKGD